MTSAEHAEKRAAWRQTTVAQATERWNRAADEFHRAQEALRAAELAEARMWACLTVAREADPDACALGSVVVAEDFRYAASLKSSIP